MEEEEEEEEEETGSRFLVFIITIIIIYVLLFLLLLDVFLLAGADSCRTVEFSFSSSSSSLPPPLSPLTPQSFSVGFMGRWSPCLGPCCCSMRQTNFPVALMVVLMVVLMLASMLDGSSGGSTPWGFSNLHYPIVPIHLGAESTLIHAGWGSATSSR